MELGTLQEVNVRDLWRHEQYDFSNWLAKEKNIEYLSDILGLTLTEINKEVYVGAYRCDLVAKDEATGIKVIIENQLEQSNHEHLGKIITYASGLDAKVVVWIVKEAREEHRSAIEWLNNNTNSDINFFLIELHAYKIGDSLPAPKFEVVEQPNGFIKNTKSNGGDDLSKTEANCLEFWSQFNEIAVSKGKPFRIRKVWSRNYYGVSIGTSQAGIVIRLCNKEARVDIEIYINDNKILFDELRENSLLIEAELGFSLEWERLNGHKHSKIKCSVQNLNFDNHSNYHELMNEIIDKVVVMKKVFAKYITG